MQAKTEDIIHFLMEQPLGKVWDLEEHKETKKRSLDSNSYFHVLVRKLAQAQNPPVSLARCKNELIAAYGVPDDLDGQQVIIKSNIPVKQMLEQEYLHTACVRVTTENGHDVYFYRVYRGSHTYNNIEMNKLIAGTVAECTDFGIEVASPDELAHMAELWKAHNEKKESKR